MQSSRPKKQLVCTCPAYYDTDDPSWHFCPIHGLPEYIISHNTGEVT